MAQGEMPILYLWLSLCRPADGFSIEFFFGDGLEKRALPLVSLLAVVQERTPGHSDPPLTDQRLQSPGIRTIQIQEFCMGGPVWVVLEDLEPIAGDSLHHCPVAIQERHRPDVLLIGGALQCGNCNAIPGQVRARKQLDAINCNRKCLLLGNEQLASLEKGIAQEGITQSVVGGTLDALIDDLLRIPGQQGSHALTAGLRFSEPHCQASLTGKAR